MPKLRNCRILVFTPFCWPMNITLLPSIMPKPPTMALSSFTVRSPCSSMKLPSVM
jgi:hypothetical protein